MGLAGRPGSGNDCELAGHADRPWGLARRGRNPDPAIGLRSLGLSLLICEAVQMKGVVRLNEKAPSLLLPSPHPLPIQSNTGERAQRNLLRGFLRPLGPPRLRYVEIS